MLGIFSLLTPIVLVLNIFALLYCMLRFKITGLITLLVLFIALPQIKNLWGFHLVKKQCTEDNDTLKMLTFNVRIFDLYNWADNQHEKSKQKIFEKLEEIDADIITFQEFYSKPNSDWDNIKAIKSELNMPYYYFSRELVTDKGRQWGIATFSKYPIVNYGELIREQTTKRNQTYDYYKAHYTDIVTPNDTIRIINCHLASIYLDAEDYSTIERISDPEGLKIKDSKTIVAKLMRAYKKRGNQVDELNKFLQSPQPHPIVLAGDFNDLPTSYSYNKLSSNFQDAYLKTNWGPGATYNGKLPGLRIDFILADKSLDICHTKKINLKTSDHFPLLMEMK